MAVTACRFPWCSSASDRSSRQPGSNSDFYELAAYPPPGTVQINPALFSALRDAGVSLVPAGFVRNTNCDNEIHQEPLWQVRDAPLAFTDQRGQVIREAPPPILQVPPKHNCAGPSALSEPLGLIGAAYLRKWGTTVFDPLGDAVWIPRSPAEQPR